MDCRFVKMFPVLTIVCLFTVSANADLIQVNYSGTVTAVTANLSGTFSVGDVLSGSFLYDSDTLPNGGATINGATYDALVEHDFQFFSGGPIYSAGIPVTPAGLPEVQIDNAGGGFPNDRLGILSRASEGLAGPDVSGLPLLSHGIRLDDFSNTAFSTALELPTSVSLSDFDDASFFTFFGNNFEGLVAGDITFFESTAGVPEPGSIAMIGAGILVCGLLGRRRNRRPVANR